MHTTFNFQGDHNYGSNKTSEKTFIYNSGCPSMQNSIQLSTKAINSVLETEKLLQSKSYIRPKVNSRIMVVEGKFIS